MHILYVDRPYTLDFNFFPIPSPFYVCILFFFWQRAERNKNGKRLSTPIFEGIVQTRFQLK